MRLLKETYAEFFQPKRFEGVLHDIENAILSHNWGQAKMAIHEAREMRVPEGILQETINSAFSRHLNHFKDMQTEMVNM